MAADGSAPAMRPPKWLRRPCGVSFGFGGTLTLFSETSASFAKVVTDEPLVARAQELQGALESHEFANYCATKAASAKALTHSTYASSYFVHACIQSTS